MANVSNFESTRAHRENVYRVFQQSFACVNDPESKQINVRANNFFLHVIFLGLPTERNLIHSRIIWVLGRLSLVQSVAPRRTRAEITCLRVDLLALGIIHECE